MKLRTGTPWMPAPDYGRSLHGLTMNLLVRNIDETLPFHQEVLGATVVYSDPDFAVLRHGDAEWMLHADHTYLASMSAGSGRNCVYTDVILTWRRPPLAVWATRC
jgi:hypothetical protein